MKVVYINKPDLKMNSRLQIIELCRRWIRQYVPLFKIEAKINAQLEILESRLKFMDLPMEEELSNTYSEIRAEYKVMVHLYEKFLQEELYPLYQQTA